MIYITSEGTSLNLEEFGERQNLVRWLIQEACTAQSCYSFLQRTAHGAIESAKKMGRPDWQSDPLLALQTDLVGQIGIKLGELSGSMSASFEELMRSSPTDTPIYVVTI